MNVGELIEELQKYPKDMLITSKEWRPGSVVAILGSVRESVFINSSKFNEYPDRLYIGHRPIPIEYNNGN